MKPTIFLSLLIALTACGPAATPTAQPPPTATMPSATIAPTEHPPTATPQQPTIAPTMEQPTVTPKAPPPTATPAPTVTVVVTPTAPPSAAVPMEPQPAVEIPPDHPAALLAMLPSDATQFVFANIETAMERPVFREELEYGLEEFVDDEKSPGEELLRSAGITALILGYNLDYDWYCILHGDFILIQNALRQASTISGVNPFTELV